MSLNKVTLIGYVGQTPDIKYFNDSNCALQLSLATTKRGYTKSDGTQIPERTEWHNLVFNNKLAEVCNKYVGKGDKLYIEGELRTKEYLTNEGVKRYITQIIVQNMLMLSSKKNSAESLTTNSSDTDSYLTKGTINNFGGTDDLPF